VVTVVSPKTESEAVEAAGEEAEEGGGTAAEAGNESE